MPANYPEALEIQVQVSGRRPSFVAQALAVSAVNGAPTLASDGVPVAGASGKSCVDTVALVTSNASTGVALRLWAYYATPGVWAPIDNSARALADGEGWTQIVRSGPVDRLYIEVTAITGGTVDLRLGPCDVT